MPAALGDPLTAACAEEARPHGLLHYDADFDPQSEAHRPGHALHRAARQVLRYGGAALAHTAGAGGASARTGQPITGVCGELGQELAAVLESDWSCYSPSASDTLRRSASAAGNGFWQRRQWTGLQLRCTVKLDGWRTELFRLSEQVNHDRAPAEITSKRGDAALMSA